MTLSVDNLRSLVPSPLADTELETIISRVEAEITATIGAPQTAALGVSLTEVIVGENVDIFVKRPISTVTTVTEFSGLTDTTGVALTENEEFYTWEAQGRLQRIGGRTPRGAPSVMSVFYMTDAQFAGESSSGWWGSHVSVVYVPTDQHLMREQATIDLIRVLLSQTALMSESVGGEYSYRAPANWELEKRRIMRRLSFVQI